MNTIASTATLLHTPTQQGEKWVVHAVATREYKQDGQIVRKPAFLYLVGRDLEQIPLMGKGTRIGFTGYFIGDFTEKEANKFSANGPVIWTRDDRDYTAWMVECTRVAIIAHEKVLDSKTQTDFTWIKFEGRLGADAEMRYTPSGQAVSNVNIAISNYVNETVDGQTVRTQYTVWLRLTFWGQQAENAAKLLKKGAGVIVEGYLNMNQENTSGAPDMYTTQNGEVRASYTITVASWIFAPGSSKNGGSAPARDQSYDAPESSGEEGEYIPF